MLVFLIAAGVVASAEPAPPANPAQVSGVTVTAPASPDTAQTGAAKARVVCHRETPIGTRFSKRVCPSVEDFAARRANSKDALQEAQRPTTAPMPAGY